MLAALLLTLSLALSPVPAAHAQKVCAADAQQVIPHVNMDRVRAVWLGWYNRTRKRLKLPAYTLNASLNRTASTWSAQAAAAGSISHKRTPESAYYSYTEIKQWFEDQGLTFPGPGTNFTENIGWGMYACNEKDCTSALTRAIRSTFQMYLDERGKASRPHFNSIVSTTFRQIGLGIAVNREQGRYYLTVHYGADVVDAACE